MKADELMIGNYVLDPYNKIIRLVSVEADQSMVIPIKITDQWLLDLDFKVKNAYQYYININEELSLQLEYNGDTYDMFLLNEGTQRYVTLEIPLYVHQIQNLYKCLCGTKLTKKQK